MKRWGISALGALACGLGTAAYADTPPTPSASGSLPNPSGPSSNNLLLSLGASDWSGEYGATTETDISALLLGARYKIGDLRLTASVPWMRIASDGVVFAGVDGTPLIISPETLTRRRTREGFGDLTLGGAYLAPATPLFGADVEIISRIKLPTASVDSGLSTGRADYSVGSEISKPFGPWTPFVSATYRSFGDPSGWRLKDGFATSAGLTYQFSNKLVYQLSYDYAQRTSAFIPDSQAIAASVSAPVPSSQIRVTAFVSKGLSNGAADFAGGLALSVSL